MSSAQKRYTIRARGYSSWADADTPAEALRLRREASDRLGVYVLIFDNSLDRDVTDELSEASE